MTERELPKSTLAKPRMEESAELETAAAAVILKTFGCWMVQTFVPIVPVNREASIMRAPAKRPGACMNVAA